MRANGSLAWQLAIPAVLVACADRPAPSEPALEPRNTAAEMTTDADPYWWPIAGTETLELSAGVRSAMTTSLTAALTEFDLQPDASMSTLHDFFQRVDAQRAERRRASSDLLPTVQP